MSWQEITERDWELIPGKQQKEPDAVDQILDQVAQGKIIRYTPDSEKDATGKRLSLARRAKRRGFTIEVRFHEGQMAVCKTGEIVSQLQPPTEEGVRDDTPPLTGDTGEAGERQSRRRSRRTTTTTEQ